MKSACIIFRQMQGLFLFLVACQCFAELALHVIVTSRAAQDLSLLG